MMYNVKLAQFEGPLELLFALIEEQKLDITRVSLAEVAGQYLEHINDRENVSLENLAQFLTVASKLILIKSKALLPSLELTDEEEEDIRDLEWQLREYKKFKNISSVMGKLFAGARPSFTREGFSGFKAVFYPPENINVFDLKKNFLAILGQIPLIEKLEEEMVREVITLEEKINHLHEHIRARAESSFAEMVSGAEDKVEVIVSFLAMLEMVKQKIIEVEQGELFQDIKMKHISNSNQ